MAQTTIQRGEGVKRAQGQFAAQVLRAFLECDDEVRKVVLEMLDIMTSAEADEDERDAAALTFNEALFPDGNFADPGMELDADFSAEEKSLVAAMAEQEKTFSSRLGQLMESKGVDQTELAKRAGVGQPAISMMLARNCRPQRRTIEKLAGALGADPKELWPE